MENVMTMTNGFVELSAMDMCDINGGGKILKALAATAGCVCIGWAPVVGVAAGIGGSVVGTPVVGVCTGIAAGAGMVSAGAALLDYACK